MDEELLARTDRIRQKTNLNYGIWRDLPDELLLLAFIPRGATIPDELRELLEREYENVDYEVFEFFGDAVLELLVTQIMFELGSITRLSDYHRFRQEIVKNLTLLCFMQQKYLCEEIIEFDTRQGDEYDDWKTCADSLEALLGVLYYYAYYIRSDREAFILVSEYFRQNWTLQEVIANLMDTGRTQCPVHGRFGPWTNWSECSNKCGKGIQTSERYCDNPSPAFGGRDCQGQRELRRNCQNYSGCPSRTRGQSYQRRGSIRRTPRQ